MIKTANFCMQASRQNYINTPYERKNDVCLYFTVYLTLPGMICLHSQQEVFSIALKQNKSYWFCHAPTSSWYGK